MDQWLMNSSFMGVDERTFVPNDFQQNQHPLHSNHQQQFPPSVYPFQAQNNTIAMNQTFQPPAFSSSSFPPLGSSQLLSMELYQLLASELDNQMQDISSYLQMENENLIALLHQRETQRDALVQNYVSRVLTFVEQKEKELALEKNRTTVLQEKLRKSESESQSWRETALSKELMVRNLKRRLKDEMEKNSMTFNGAPEAESQMMGDYDPGRENEKMVGNCKFCGQLSSCMAFLPCKHLCSCKLCEVSNGYCPVCLSPKDGSVEILFG